MATTAEIFIREMLPHAEEASLITGLHRELILAQAALESAWGRKAPGNNFFGVKGKGQSFATHEEEDGKRIAVKASFRKYDSPLESFLDWASVIKKNFAHIPSETTLEGQIAAFGMPGRYGLYATDQLYTQKLAERVQRVQALSAALPLTPEVVYDSAEARQGAAAGDGSDDLDR